MRYFCFHLEKQAGNIPSIKIRCHAFVRLRGRRLEIAKEACGEEKVSTQQDKVLQTRQNGAYDVTKAGKDIASSTCRIRGLFDWFC